MWSPTHVQVTVCRAKGLLTKGKHGTNDAFVVIALGKEKFQTSVKQKAPTDLDWQEECELSIPDQGNTAEIILTVLHQNFIGVDEFLGTISLPLASFDVYERPKNRWYTLHSKPGQESKTKYRGEMEVRVAFTVKSGSLLDLSKKEKHKGSLGQLGQAAQSFGGSLMSLGSKEKKNIKKLASSVGHKLSKLPGRGALRKEKREGSSSRRGSESIGEPDPGVISEDEDEFRFDELSHKSSGSSLNVSGSRNTSVSGSMENLAGGEFMRRNSMPRNSNNTLPRTPTISPLAIENPPKPAGSSSKEDPVDEWDKKLFGKQGKLAESSGPVQSGVPSIIVQGSNPFEGDNGVLPQIKEESLGQFDRRKPVTVSLTRRRDLAKEDALADVFEDVEPVKEEPKTKIKGKEAAVVIPVPRDPSPAPRSAARSTTNGSANIMPGKKEPTHMTGETMHSHLHARASSSSPPRTSSDAPSFPVILLRHGEPGVGPAQETFIIDSVSELRVAGSTVLVSASSPPPLPGTTEERPTPAASDAVQASPPTQVLPSEPYVPVPKERNISKSMEIKPVPLPRSNPFARDPEPVTQIQVNWGDMQESRVDDEPVAETNTGFVDLWSYQPEPFSSLDEDRAIPNLATFSPPESKDRNLDTADSSIGRDRIESEESSSTRHANSKKSEVDREADVDIDDGVVELSWVEPCLQTTATSEDEENVNDEEIEREPIDRSSYYKIVSESTINQSLLLSSNVSSNFTFMSQELSPIRNSEFQIANHLQHFAEPENEEIMIVAAPAQNVAFSSSGKVGQMDRITPPGGEFTRVLSPPESKSNTSLKALDEPVIEFDLKRLENSEPQCIKPVDVESLPSKPMKQINAPTLSEMSSSFKQTPTSPHVGTERDLTKNSPISSLLPRTPDPNSSSSTCESGDSHDSLGRKVLKADPTLLYLDSEVSESDDCDDILHSKDLTPGSKEHRAALASFPQRVVEGKEMAEEEVPLKFTKKELSQFEGKSRDELISLICTLKSSVVHRDQQIQELKEYIGELLLRVMENAPGILQNPPSPVN